MTDRLRRALAAALLLSVLAPAPALAQVPFGWSLHENDKHREASLTWQGRKKQIFSLLCVFPDDWSLQLFSIPDGLDRTDNIETEAEFRVVGKSGRKRFPVTLYRFAPDDAWLVNELENGRDLAGAMGSGKRLVLQGRGDKPALRIKLARAHDMIHRMVDICAPG